MKRLFITLITVVLVTVSLSARQPRKGYRGFIEWNNSIGSEYNQTVIYTGVSNTHGYQINPMFFVGAGLSVERYPKWDEYLVPVYLRGRADFKFKEYTPFTDLSIGYNTSKGGGFYYSQNIGYRFNWGRKAGLNVGAGVTFITYNVEMYDIIINEDFSMDMNYAGQKKMIPVFFSLKLGIDF